MKKKNNTSFQFKQFSIEHDRCAMKVGTDGVLLGAWANIENAKNILDIGTGSGLISIMMAQRNKNAHIVGVEIDKNAALQAQENINNSPWKDRLKIIHQSIQNYTQETLFLFDHIISNPPFFSVQENKIDARKIARQTLTLNDLDLIDTSIQLLKKEGKLSIILPFTEGNYFINEAAKRNLFLSKKTNVYPKKDKPIERLLLEFKKSETKNILNDSIIIQKEKRNDWTQEYIQLTQAFYLKM